MLNPDHILPRLVAARARAEPDRIFIEDVAGGILTYGALHDGALRWADAYQRIGVSRGGNVIHMLPTRLEYWLSWFGLAWLGGVDVPINTEYRGPILEHVLVNSDARLAITVSPYLDRLADVASGAPKLQTVVVLDNDDVPGGLPFQTVPLSTFLDGSEPHQPDRTPELWDLASIIYTSGTTGVSKGVMLPWGHIVRFTNFAPIEELAPEDVFYAPFPTFHMGVKSIPQLMAQVGGRIIVRDRLSVSEFWSDIAKFGCTTTVLVGAMVPMVSGHSASAEDAKTPLRNVIMAPVWPDVDTFKERFGVRVCTAYAMTELPLPFNSRGFTVTSANHRSCGKLAEGLEVRLVDEHDYDVPEGAVGELVARPTEPWTMALGYFGMPEQTARSWRNGWFHSGDTFSRDAEGNYFFVDRVKDYIRRRGENISSFEVEAIVRSHPSVAEVAAIPVPSALGEDEVMVAIALRDKESLTPEALIEYLIPRMPRFMVPRYVEFVDELPKTEATLRVQKHVLRDRGVTPATWDREEAGIVIPTVTVRPGPRAG